MGDQKTFATALREVGWTQKHTMGGNLWYPPSKK
jgi:hypothetical protein